MEMRGYNSYEVLLSFCNIFICDMDLLPRVVHREKYVYFVVKKMCYNIYYFLLLFVATERYWGILLFFGKITKVKFVIEINREMVSLVVFKRFKLSTISEVQAKNQKRGFGYITFTALDFDKTSSCNMF